MNTFDLIALSTLAGGALLGFYRGLIRQAVSIASLIGGILIAGRFYAPVAEWLHGPSGGGLVADENWARIIAFVAVLIAFTIALGFVGSLLRFVAKMLMLGWLDRLLGALLGLLMSLTGVMALVVVATVFPVPGLSDSIQGSKVAEFLGGYVPVVLTMLPPEFQQYWQIIQLAKQGFPLPFATP